MKITSLCLPVLLCAVAGVATAQVLEPVDNDLSGNWVPISSQDSIIRGGGPNPGAYEGIPINDQARDAALSYSGQTLDELNMQCNPWSATYLDLGPFGAHIWSTVDTLTGRTVAWHIGGSLDRPAITIWVDGRSPPPPDAVHTFNGYTTGHWIGETLIAVTTHLKDQFLYRNGVPASNQQTMTLFLTRHDRFLTITEVIHDPVYLSASFVVTATFRSDPVIGPAYFFTNGGAVKPQTCMPEEQLPGFSDGYHVARYLPGTNPLADAETKAFGIPPVATRGGAQTMYPEFKEKLKGVYKQPPGYCKGGMRCGFRGANG